MSSNNYNPKPEFLQDVKNGKEIDWKGKKLENLELAASYKRIGSNKYYRVLDCSTFLEWKYYFEINEKRLAKANFCKVRLCPMCSWRRSLKIFGQVFIKLIRKKTPPRERGLKLKKMYNKLH